MLAMYRMIAEQLAGESLQRVSEVSVGTGSLEERDRRRVIRQWQRLAYQGFASGDSKLTSRTEGFGNSSPQASPGLKPFTDW